ncbi:MAG: hypothetical protein FWG88_05525 [Oscillospiraceae bacterium]|nr:hypothetical protein [Oscillospiraceae bacterium]
MRRVNSIKLHKVILSILLCLFFTSACSSILEGDMRVESEHRSTTGDRLPEEVEVSNFSELKEAIVELIYQHETTGQIIVYRYDSDIQWDIDRAIDEVMETDPIARYAVVEISTTLNRIVTFFEIDLKIEYRRSREQVASIVNVSTLRYLRTELFNIMSEYRNEASFQTALHITEDDMIAYIKDSYYQNPRNIIIMPVAVVEIYSTEDSDRIVEVRLHNIELPSVLQQYGESLARSVRLNALAAEGETDAEILLSLAKNLIDACDFDEGTARTISEHGIPNLAATAYSALVRGTAVGEGFAMAFKALCDELGFECQVVLGYLNNMVHAWNIIMLNGDYYHVDIAMCAANGIESAFIKSDAQFANLYIWDTDNTVRCNGTLTLDDIYELLANEGVEDNDLSNLISY